MQSYIKISPDAVIEICQTKLERLEMEEEEIIEKNIKMNIKPKRKFLFFFTLPEVTREDATLSLDDSFDDDASSVTYREYICRFVYKEIYETKKLIALAEKAKESSDKMVRLTKDDVYFLNH